jgi:hypothetical protein
MPRKTRANHARAENLRKITRKPKASIEEVPDEEPIPAVQVPHPLAESHEMSTSNGHNSDDIDPELLDIIGALRGTAMVDDEDDVSELGSENDEDEIPEIQEISALEQFSSTLQKAHDLALAAEREREKGRKRPKRYHGNSLRTKQRCRQLGREFSEKGFHSVKEWFQKMSATGTPDWCRGYMGQ